MEGYLQAAQTSSAGKEGCLKQLLGSTDACLRQLSRRLAIMPGRSGPASQAAPATEKASPGLPCSLATSSHMHVLLCTSLKDPCWSSCQPRCSI